MALQTLPLAESSAAGAAGERLLARVDAVVSLQVALRREGFPARRAHEVFPRDALQNEAGGGALVLLLLELRGLRLISFNSSSWRKNHKLSVMASCAFLKYTYNMYVCI